MEKVFSAGSYIEAQLLRGYLEQAGIGVTIVNENSSGAPGSPHWAFPVAAEIWVLEDRQKAEASALIKQYFAQLTDTPGHDWPCAGCGEDNPGSFELCWNCGHGHS